MIIAFSQKIKQYFLEENTSKNSLFFEKSVSSKDLNSYKKNIDVIKFSKKNKQLTTVIFSDDKEDYSLLYYNQSIWKKLNHWMITLIYLDLKNDLKIFIKDKNLLPDVFLQLIEKKHIIISEEEKADFFIDNETGRITSIKKNFYEFEYEKICFIDKNSFFQNEITVIIQKYGFLEISKSTFKTTLDKFKVLQNKIFKNEKLNELTNSNFISINTDSKINIKYKCKYGWTYVEFNEETNEASSFVYSLEKKWTDLYYFTRGITNNINWTTNETLNEKYKFPKKKLIFGFFGLSIFVTLTTFTFINLFSGEDIYKSFNVIWNGMDTPWPYLLLINYIISSTLFISVGFIIAKSQKRQYKFKEGLSFYISGHVSRFVSIITGSHLLGVAAWVWYLRAGTKQTRKTATLIGSMSVMSVIRVCFSFIMVSIFLSINSWYAYQLTWPDSWYGPTYLVVLSWIGLVVYTMISLASSALFLVPSFNKWIFIIWGYILRFTKKDNYFAKTISMSVRSEQLQEARRSGFDKTAIIRIISISLANHIINLFELSYVFSMIAASGDYYAPLEQIPYWTAAGIFELNAMKISISYMNKLNPLPGEMYTTEWTQIASMQAIVITYVDPNTIPIEDANEWITNVSTQSAFITRFFGFYLPVVASSIVTSYIVIKKTIQLKRLKVKHV